MSKKILWLHHFHAYWENELNKFNTSFENELNKVIDFVNNTDLDEVIITMFEEYQLQPEHYKLIEICENKNIKIIGKEYGYAWTRDDNSRKKMFPKSLLNKTWCYGTRDYHTQEDIIEIEDWQIDFKKNNDYVLLAGAFENECLLDAETVLDVLKINYKKIDELSVGAFVEYKYKDKNPSQLYENILQEISILENLISEFFDDNDIDEDINEIIDKNPKFIKKIFKNVNNLISENLKYIEDYKLDIYSTYDFLNDFIIDSINNNGDSSLFLDNIKEKTKKIKKYKKL